MVVTTKVARTMKNTEQNARQKWNFLRFKSLHWYVAKNLVDGQNFIEFSLFCSSGSFKLFLDFLLQELSHISLRAFRKIGAFLEIVSRHLGLAAGEDVVFALDTVNVAGLKRVFSLLIDCPIYVGNKRLVFL